MKKLYWFAYVCLLVCAFIWALNYGLVKLYGFGNPIIYDNNPIYGYRPLPNQEVVRKDGKRVKINNLGLRCNQDWDTITSNKILILGNSVTYGGSYIDNSELFSTLITNDTNLLSGSAGVNAWGVMNLYGLTVIQGFQPADTYITVLIEGDFYRGLTRSSAYQWKQKPTSAIHEVLVHYLFDFIQKSVNGSVSSSSMQKLIVENAVKYLKEMNMEFIKKGKKHMVFISPSASQVWNGSLKDTLVQHELEKAGLKVTYLLDEVIKSKKKSKNLFYDHVHLDVEGHKLWANIIRKHLF